MKTAKKIVSVLLALILAVSMTACGGGGSTGNEGGSSGGNEGGNKVITFAGWGSLAEKKIFTAMIDKFEETHPGVKVNYQHIPGTQEDYLVKLISLLAANKMPDVFYIHSDEFYSWVDADRLENLTPYMEQSELAASTKIWDKSLNIFRYDAASKQVGVESGDLYGLPKDLGPWAMVYNKTLFEAKGVALPDPKEPMTWTEFVDVCKQLTDGEGINKVFGTANYTLEAAVWSNGADYLSEDKTQVTVDTPEFAEAMQWVADLALVEGVSPTPEEDSASGWFQRWVNGKVGMAWMGPWDQATFWDSVSFEWDIMPTPVSDKTGKGVSWLASAALCVSKTSEEKQLAYELAEFLSMDAEAQTYNYEAGQAVPNIIDMAKNDYLSMNKAPANKQVFLDIIENPEKGQFKSVYFTKNTTWYSYFNAESSKVWSGEMTAAEFLKQIQPAMQERLDSGK
ncbi:MAG: sugar ABC transporter substrate-binding protein [Oscillospiraceae bacterium]|nr:sugar ABC transporter substrate-binding protein [Oscillospiraceae bacterium]